jgi:hypothetical protein
MISRILPTIQACALPLAVVPQGIFQDLKTDQRVQNLKPAVLRSYLATKLKTRAEREKTISFKESLFKNRVCLREEEGGRREERKEEGGRRREEGGGTSEYKI